jgi:hypothetical protein
MPLETAPISGQYLLEAVEKQRNAVMNELAHEQAFNRMQAARIAELEDELNKKKEESV